MHNARCRYKAVLLSFLTAYVAELSGCATGGSTADDHDAPASGQFSNAKRWARIFEDPKRDQWQKPEQVIKMLQLQPNSSIAEIGAATGYFSTRLAKEAPRGVVYAIDIEPSMVEYLRVRSTDEKISNMRPILGEPGNPAIPEPVDMVFIANTYHHIHGRVSYFEEVARQLKPNGNLVILDFKQGKVPEEVKAPPPRFRVSPSTVNEELLEAGYRRVELNMKLLPYQFMAIYRKGAPAQPARM